MTRPWQVWLIFACCSLVVLATMWWLSAEAVRSDAMRQSAEATMQREQQISLALWRMDTKLAPLIAEEAARPYYVYDSFIAVGNTWTPSPLLAQNQNVRLNFNNYISTNEWTSPQVPQDEFAKLAAANGIAAAQIGENRTRLNKLAATVNPKQLLKRLPKQQIATSTTPLASQNQYSQETDIFGNSQASENQSEDQQTLAQAPNQIAIQSARSQQIALPQVKIAKGKQQRDYGQRGARFQGAVQKEITKQRAGNYLGGYENFGAEYGGEYGVPTSPILSAATDTIIEGISKPLLVNGELLLARRIVKNGEAGIQGSWLDWPNLKADLLTEVTELLPNADLRLLQDVDQGDPSRMLAGLPAELVLPPIKAVYLPANALRWTLGIGWLGVLIALGSAAALLWGVLALSERRAAFVSSVTHELRTPLTTFRMYADMLARDMVPDADRRQEYLMTLQREAERLTHLVENVLSYARLERGRGANNRETVAVADLLERQQARLAERAAQAELRFELLLPSEVRDMQLTTDVGVVEQILFNLVDNAAKYASEADDRRILCDVYSSEKNVEFAIRDFGPGFASTRRARKPKPFSKTAEQAATSKPGVGLGLALCRRLATQLGGKLTIGGADNGAVVTLSLPGHVTGR